MGSIVTVNVSVAAAPVPSNRQATGAAISQGATKLTSLTYALLSQASDLTPLLAAPLAMSSLAWSGGVVTAVTTAVIPGLAVGDKFWVTIADAVPAGYNGTYLATVTGTSTFTYVLSASPGTETTPGTYTPPNQVELKTMVNTFFGQGTRQALYVLELGAGDGSTGPTALTSFISANPGFFYSYLVPRGWDGSGTFAALISQNGQNNAMTYFFVTTTTSTYTQYTTKAVVDLVEAPTIPATEFSLATAFQVALSYAPSSTNKMTPLGFSFLYGVTPYPSAGNASLLNDLEAANANVVGTGAEGGITNDLMAYGTTADGNDFSYWYSIDWLQINSDLNISNAVINGSNNKVNPLWYNQDGINRLQDVEVGTVRNAVTYGLATGSVLRTALPIQQFLDALDAGAYDGVNVVNAEPFITYLSENPNDYKAGKYGGITVAYLPARAFKHIIINVQVTDFLTQ